MYTRTTILSHKSGYGLGDFAMGYSTVQPLELVALSVLSSFRRAPLHFNLLLTFNKSVARVSLHKGFQVYPLLPHLPCVLSLSTSTSTWHISYPVHLN